MDIHYFEQAIDEISRLGEEIEFVQGLLEDEDVADENGNWSDAGITRLGLYTNQMEEAAAKAKMYQDEIDKLNTQYANGELSEEQYQERLSELVSGQQDAIQSYEDAKDGIIELNEARIDAIKDGIDKEIEAYEDLIDLKKEELDAERDLYDFRKNVKKQTKDIASLERRIAALSGSTAASDIAERRKLQAELNEAREGLNDTYYERSKDQQNQALDDEAEAFRESKEKYIEELEATLEDAETLITNSIMDVLTNADTVLAQLNEISDTYGITLSAELTQPWVDAANKPKEYWTNAKDAITGYADFLTSSELSNKFSSTITGFGTQIQTIIDKWNGVKKAADDAYAAQTRKVTVGGNQNVEQKEDPKEEPKKEPQKEPPKDTRPEMYKVGSAGSNDYIDKTVVVNGKDGKTYYGIKGRKGFYVQNGSFYSKTGWINEGSYTYKMKQYAKGTIGTSRDEWALTDEIGDELVLVPGANGNLSFMRKGTSVIPADITANLVEWGKLNPNMLNVGGRANINMISNAINKPEINLDIAEFLHVDKVDKDTMPELERFVDKKMNELVRQLNYSIKKFK
jgi:hypothetical protein